jgi:hypothetical protein
MSFENLEDFKYDSGKKVLAPSTNQNLKNFVTGTDLNNITEYLNKLKNNINFLQANKLTASDIQAGGDLTIDSSTGKVTINVKDEIRYFNCNSVSKITTDEKATIKNKSIVVINPKPISEQHNKESEQIYQMFYYADDEFLPINFNYNVLNNIPELNYTQDSATNVAKEIERRITLPTELLTEDCNTLGTVKFIHDYVSAALNKEYYHFDSTTPIGTIFPHISDNLEEIQHGCCRKLNGQTLDKVDEEYPDFWNWLTSQIGEYKTVPICKPWTQTPLTANGTMGDSKYACSTDGTIVNGRNVWESFNKTAGNNETVCILDNTKSGSITFYSPVPLRINSVTFTRDTGGTTNANKIISYVISGSNDNVEWTELASGDFTDLSASATLNIPIDSSKYRTNYSYKYYKFYGANGGGSDTAFPKIYLYGEEFVRAKQESNGSIRAINAEEFDVEVTEYGACGAFVVDTEAGSVRLPNLTNAFIQGADSSTIGQTVGAGLPNHNHLIEGTAKHGMDGFNPKGVAYFSNGDSSNYPVSKLTNEVDSNPIYGNSETVQPLAGKYCFYIQLANGVIPAALRKESDLDLVNAMPLGTIYNAGGSNIPSGAFALNGQLIENCFEKYPDFWKHITTNVDIYDYSSGVLEIVNKNWENSTLTLNNVYGSNKVGEINIDKNNPIYVSRDTAGNITNPKIAVNNWYTVPYGEGQDWGINYNKPMIATTTPYNSTRVGWKSFDYLNYKSEYYDTCFMSYTGAGAITFYNPLPIQLTHVIFTRSYNFGQGFYQLRVAKIYGSTNNKDWELLADNSKEPWIAGTGPNEDNYKGASLSYTNPEPISLDLQIDSEKAFNYIKIIGHRDTAWQNAAKNNCCEFGQIRLVGKECNYIDESLEKIFTIGKESDKNIKVLNIEQSEKFNTVHPGNSIFFGINFTKEIEEIEEAGTYIDVISNIEFDTKSQVKLPDYSSLTLLESNNKTNTIPVHGNGIALGLTDKYQNMGIVAGAVEPSQDRHGLIDASIYIFGTSVGTAIGRNGQTDPTAGNPSNANLALGVTTDGTKSGLVADITTNSLISNNINWVIQVYNAITSPSVYDPSSLIKELPNKADIDGSNITQAFKDKIIDCMMLDYSAGLDITSNFRPNYSSSYTAPCAGIVLFVSYGGTYGYVTSLKVNDIVLPFTVRTDSGEYMSFYNIPMSKNDVLSLTTSIINVIEKAMFIPMKGAYK